MAENAPLVESLGLFEPVPIEPVPDTILDSLSGNAAEERRWRSHAVLAPIERLVRSLRHADVVDDDYDVRRLAHRTIDLAVESMSGLGRETSDQDIVRELAVMARAMAPDAKESDWIDIGNRVFQGLLNAQSEYEKFRYVHIADGGVRRPYSFRLLELAEAEDGYAVKASSEAINLFVSSALDMDPADAERASQHLIARQLARGQLDQAVLMAETAGRAAAGYAAQIGEAVEAARRDVDAEAWASTVEPLLQLAAEELRDRIRADDEILEKVHELTGSSEPGHRARAGQVGETIRAAKAIHAALDRRLLSARPAFLEAQRVQRLNVRRRLRLLSLSRELLDPALALERSAALGVVNAFGDHALGLRVPRLVRIDALIDLLLRPAVIREPHLADIELLDDDGEGTDPQAFPAVSLAAAGAIMGTARQETRRLSSLLSTARDTGDPDVVILVRLASLYTFAPEPSADDAAPPPGDLVAGLAAIDDGARLADDEYAGADLLVGATDTIAAIDAASTVVEPDGPPVIDLERERRKRR